MSFLLSPDLAEFDEVLGKFFAEEFPAGSVRGAMLDQMGARGALSGFEVEKWKKIVELGALVAGLPEDASGLGFGLLAFEILLTKSAAALSSLPLFETLALGALPILALGSEGAKSELLPRIGAGELRLTGPLLGTLSKVVTTKDPKLGVTLAGEMAFVPSFALADALVVIARDSKGQAPGLFLVDKQATGIIAESIATLDLIRSFSKIKLENVPAKLLSQGALAAEALAELREQVAVLIAAELVGVSSRALEMTVDYVKTRQQFGKPIGTFQAIQHQLADMHLGLEQMAKLVRFAAACSATDKSQFHSAAIAAKGFASELAPKIIEGAIQAHGGIGFTYEYDLHLYLRRAQVLSALAGDAREMFRMLGEIGIGR